MKIEVVSAIGGSKMVFEVESKTTFADLKKKISQVKNLPADTFVLAFRGREQADHLTLKEAGVEEQDKIYLIVRTEGG
ncbi:MAG: ubiquitin family protein [Candidatus Odinarchaeota archaeon]